MCWAFDVSIAILTPFTRRASQHASRTHLSHAARTTPRPGAGPGTGNGDRAAPGRVI